MPKMKTRKSAIKRIKITGTGRIMRRKTGNSHLKSVKSPSCLRSFRKDIELSPGFTKVTRRLLGL